MTHCAELYDTMTKHFKDKFYFSNFTARGVEGGLKYKDNIYLVKIEWLKHVEPPAQDKKINEQDKKINESVKHICELLCDDCQELEIL